MRELLWVIAIVAASSGWLLLDLLPSLSLIQSGQTLMLGSAALGIPLQIAYFGALALALRSTADGAPPGWYWRSFDHHDQLLTGQRRLVLPIFYVGALSFVGVVCGMATVVLGLLTGWKALA